MAVVAVAAVAVIVAAAVVAAAAAAAADPASSPQIYRTPIYAAALYRRGISSREVLALALSFWCVSRAQAAFPVRRMRANFPDYPKSRLSKTRQIKNPDYPNAHDMVTCGARGRSTDHHR